MIVEVTKIPNSGKDFDLKLEPGEIDFESEFAKVSSETKFAGRINYLNLRTIIEGEIKSQVELNCNRCFLPIPQSLDFSFKNAYILAEEYTKEEESKLEDKGLEISIFEGDKIDLKVVASEQIALSLPMQMVCKEDCNGLCETCGVNLNNKSCTCKDEQVDPRWAALKNLKK